MSDQSVTKEELPAGWSRYGGRALTSAMVFTEVPPDADALGPDNVLVFAPGLLGGTNTPNGGRLSVGAKSPLTGGHQGVELRRPGCERAGSHWVSRPSCSPASQPTPARSTCSRIEADGTASLSRVDEWAGAGNYEVADAIKGMRPEGDRYSTITNGPAGEAGLKAAGIAVSDMKGYPNRFAGRGGLGAVMGSKGLKAIVISDKGLKAPEHADKEAFSAAIKIFSAALKDAPGLRSGSARRTARTC